MLFAMGGIAVSAYLTYAHYDDRALACGIGDCATVQASPWASFAGIPVAVLGLASYLVLGAIAALRLARPSWASSIELPLWGGTLAGLIYSGYLTYIELFELHAICQWCVVSALLMTALFLSETVLLARTNGDE